MKITKLRCDYMENPLGFDFEHPYFGWVIESEQSNKSQSAYHLQIAKDDAFTRVVYDSDKVCDDRSVGVQPDFKLEPKTRYHWRVNIWDEEGVESGFSQTAHFETARYDEPWKAEWICAKEDIPLPQLRKSFKLREGIKRARVYVSGVGLYCLFVNGKRVGEDVLAPFFNAYDKWLQYQTYDVTALLKTGDNAAGAWLGNGYFIGRVNWPGIPERRGLYGDTPGLIMELEVEYLDGSLDYVLTDGTWKASESPFLRSEIYDGEYFDARKLVYGWDRSGCDDSAWDRAILLTPPKGELQARRSVPLKVMGSLPCREVILTPCGETVLDFGQNISGWVRFKTHASKGTEILLQAGEVLDKDGNFYRENMRTAMAEQRYICRGDGEEYAPWMTFMGFRYMRITGLEHKEVNPEDFTAEFIYSSMEQTGWFECSDERVNRLFQNALWSQRDNFVDVPTDCPQRDERMGWTGDAQVFVPTACLNMEADAFFRKYLYDLAVEQKAAGYVPVVVPNFLTNSGKWSFTTTGWADAALIIPWTLYLYYGDKEVLRRQYDSMKGWVEFMHQQDTENTDRYGGFHLGDWLAQDTKDAFNLFGATPTSLIATAYYAYSAKILAKTALVLGYHEDAEIYQKLSDRVRDAFQREYLTPNGRVLSETQTAHVVTLFMDLYQEGKEDILVSKLSDRLHEDHLKLTTGFIGTPYLCPVLSEHGLNEYAYHLLLLEECPSWLYAVQRGATTIWERWNGIAEDGTFGPVGMNSFNHYAYGSIAEWMYRYAAGINPLEEAPGFKRIRLAPKPNSLLSYAKASVRTQYGLLSSEWKLTEDKQIILTLTIPFNTTADIELPDVADGAEILENGKPLRGDRFARGSGTWVYAYRYGGEMIDKRIRHRAAVNI